MRSIRHIRFAVFPLVLLVSPAGSGHRCPGDDEGRPAVPVRLRCPVGHADRHVLDQRRKSDNPYTPRETDEESLHDLVGKRGGGLNNGVGAVGISLIGEAVFTVCAEQRSPLGGGGRIRH